MLQTCVPEILSQIISLLLKMTLYVYLKHEQESRASKIHFNESAIQYDAMCDAI